MNTNDIRYEFLRLLTKDSDHTDRRKKDYNQALFIVGEPFNGCQVFNGTTLDMIMDKFDKAVKNLEDSQCHKKP